MKYILIAALLAVASTSAAADKLTQETAEASVTKYLQENVNDPAKLSIVAFGGADLSQCSLWIGPEDYTRDERDQYPDYFKPAKHKGWAIICKYRASNALGAIVLNEQGFILNESGRVVKLVSVHSIKVNAKK